MPVPQAIFSDRLHDLISASAILNQMAGLQESLQAQTILASIFEDLGLIEYFVVGFTLLGELLFEVEVNGART